MDHESLQGHTVKRIPFSHPSNLIGIITILRQQAVFNAIIGSCIRTTGIQGIEKKVRIYMLVQKISVSQKMLAKKLVN